LLKSEINKINSLIKISLHAGFKGMIKKKELEN